MKFEIGEVCECRSNHNRHAGWAECTVTGLIGDGRYWIDRSPASTSPRNTNGWWGAWPDQLRKKKPPQQDDSEAWGDWRDMMHKLRNGVPA